MRLRPEGSSPSKPGRGVGQQGAKSEKAKKEILRVEANKDRARGARGPASSPGANRRNEVSAKGVP